MHRSSRGRIGVGWAIAGCFAFILGVELWHSWTKVHIAMSASGYRAADYSVSGYFTSYSDGFIRRGLVGSVFALLTTPTWSNAHILFWALTATSYLALLVIAVQVAAVAPGDERWLVLLLVLSAPFSIRGVADYLGRYDAVGLAVIGALTVIGSRPRLWLRDLTAGVLLTCAMLIGSLSEEFLFFYLVPVIVAFELRRGGPIRLVHSRVSGGARRLLTAAVPLLAGGAAFLASALSHAPASELAEAQHKAQASFPNADAATFLGYSFSDELRYMRAFGTGNVLAGMTMWVVIFAVACLALNELMGRLGRIYWLSAGYCAGVGAFLCYIAADWRRWWVIAFAAQLAVAAIVSRSLHPADAATDSDGRTASASQRFSAVVHPGRPRLAVLATLLLTLTLGFYTGVFPARTLVEREYWKSDLSYWVPGHHRVACVLGLSSSHC